MTARSQFDADTAVAPISDDLWAAHVSPAWSIGANPNGGYLAAIVLQAMKQLGPHPDPLTVTAHFLRPGTAGADAEVRTRLLRSGRSLTTARGTLVQDGKERVEILAAFGDLSHGAGVDAELTIPPPDMPPPEDCPVRSGDEQAISLPLLERVDIRIHPDQALAGQAGRAEMSGWIRFTDDHPADTVGLVLMTDAFPPSPFGLLGATGWVPTIEITVHVRRRPAPGWLCGRFTTDDLTGGRMVENGALWDSTGALVAQCRQLALVR